MNLGHELTVLLNVPVNKTIPGACTEERPATSYKHLCKQNNTKDRPRSTTSTSYELYEYCTSLVMVPNPCIQINFKK